MLDASCRAASSLPLGAPLPAHSQPLLNPGSVHVTPTVFVNGLEAGVVGSGWTGAEWKQFLSPMGADNWQGTQL